MRKLRKEDKITKFNVFWTQDEKRLDLLCHCISNCWTRATFNFSWDDRRIMKLARRQTFVLAKIQGVNLHDLRLREHLIAKAQTSRNTQLSP